MISRAHQFPGWAIAGLPLNGCDIPPTEEDHANRFRISELAPNDGDTVPVALAGRGEGAANARGALSDDRYPPAPACVQIPSASMPRSTLLALLPPDGFDCGVVTALVAVGRSVTWRHVMVAGYPSGMHVAPRLLSVPERPLCALPRHGSSCISHLYVDPASAYAADTLGRVFVLPLEPIRGRRATWEEADITDEETGGPPDGRGDDDDAAPTTAPRRPTPPTLPHLPPVKRAAADAGDKAMGGSDALECAPLTLHRGASHTAGSNGYPGWCALHGAGKSSGGACSQLLRVREGFRDLSVIDLESSRITQRLFMSQSPSASTVLSDASAPATASVVAIAEGRTLSVWDLRVSGAETPAPGQRCVRRQVFAEEILDCVASTSSVSASAAVAGGGPSPHFLVYSSADRSVGLIDTRQWAKIAECRSVLKHQAAFVVPMSRTHAVAGGCGAEARVVEFNVQASSGAAGDHGTRHALDPACSRRGTATTHPPQSEVPPAGCAGTFIDLPATAGGPQNAHHRARETAFDKRLATTVHCWRNWHGRWIPTTADSSHMGAALGLATNGDLFVASAK